jgi:hypothetical protein
MSSAVKDFDGYVFFSKNTVGTIGKPVKIHSSLFLDFFCNVDPNSQEGQAMIRDIENLRGDPRANQPGLHPRPAPRGKQSVKHINNLQKISQSLDTIRECNLVTRNLQVFFTVEQQTGDKYPTVYISRIRRLQKNSQEAGGFYEMRGGFQKSAIKVEDCNLENKTCYISRATSLTPKKVFEDTENLFGNNIALFYNPVQVADEFVLTKRNRLSIETQQSIKELENNIKRNQKKNVNWFVDGEGAAVLAEALANVPGSLETHSFKFTNAKANLPKLMKDLSQKKAKLTGEFISFSADKTALLAIAYQNEKLIAQLSALPNSGGYETITRRYLLNQLTALGAVKHALAPLSTQESLTANKITFIDALKGLFKPSPIGVRPK